MSCRARCSVSRIEVFWLPASEWWISSCGSGGFASRSRSHNAIRRGVITRSVLLDVDACQARIRCAYTSTMNETYTNPVQVRT